MGVVRVQSSRVQSSLLRDGGDLHVPRVVIHDGDSLPIFLDECTPYRSMARR